MNAVYNFCVFYSISCIWLYHTSNLNPENPDEINYKTLQGFL